MAGKTITPPWLLPGVLAALFVILMGAGVVLAPDPVRPHAEAGEFDARASRERLARMLGHGAPHPVDSAAQDDVRSALLGEIAVLGFRPEIHDAFTCRPQERSPLVDCAFVRNIIFSIGPAGGPSVLASAHYDSVPAGPGASDDGIGVSVLLEIARTLAREPLQRRVIFLLSDGEEPGLFGAYAFATGDPLMESVQAIVNLEARGSRGPAIFFESNAPNADAVAAYGAVRRPVANSVTADVYRLLPNFTDVSVLARPGVDVVNIALLDGVEDYHTPQDTIASQDLRSVQHMGDSGLATLRRLASSADRASSISMAYTDIGSRFFISAPVMAVLTALALSAIVAFVAFWRVGPERRWGAFFAPPLAVIAAGALAFAADYGLRLFRPGEDYAFAHPEPTRAWCILMAMTAVLLVTMLLRAARNPEQAGAAGVFWFAAFGGAASVVAPGISILFALPAVGYALVWLAALAWPPGERLARWSAAIMVLGVWAPVLYLVELALGYDVPAVFAILVTLLLLPWLGVLSGVKGGNTSHGVTGAVAAGALAVVFVAGLTPSRSEARPQALNLSYFVNASNGQARILAGAATRALPPELREGFTPEMILPGDRLETWSTPVPVAPIPAPALENATTETVSGGRLVRGRLAMNGAYRATIRIPLASQPQRVRVNGVETDFADTGGEPLGFMSVACQGRACDGADIEIILGQDVMDDWFIIGQTPGFAVGAAETVRARRPTTTTPIQFGDSAISLTRFRPGG